MIASQFIDDFGAWDDLGIVAPKFEEWQEYPFYSTSTSSLVRLVYGGDLRTLNSYAYIRSIYVLGNQFLYSPWVRIYPKSASEYIQYPHPSEFGLLKDPPKRYFEVQKRHKRRNYVGIHFESVWTLNIQICNESVPDLQFTEEEELLITGALY